jgi:hypothetical protein
MLEQYDEESYILAKHELPRALINAQPDVKLQVRERILQITCARHLVVSLFISVPIYYSHALNGHWSHVPELELETKSMTRR